MKYLLLMFTITILCLSSCQQGEKLQVVSTAEFAEFVEATDYITDAERYGWSVVQKNVWNFEIVYGISWRCPDGISPASLNYPVTQVSYNDALAYCAWKKCRLPSYNEYWRMVSDDHRPKILAYPGIEPLDQVNIIGNVWEITDSFNQNGEIRLAGGSYLCDVHTCDGASPERRLFVDRETGNSHVGFCVVWR